MNRHRLSIIAGILLVSVALAILSGCGSTPSPVPTPTPTPPPIPTAPPSMELGVNGLNGPRQANGKVSEAVDVGAVRDRWSVEWFWVEQPWRDDLPWGEGNFNWQGVFPTLRDPLHVDPPTSPIPFDITSITETELTPLVALHGIPRLYDCTYWSVERYPDYPEATSRCAGSSDRIAGLFEPALQDGQANPDNKWARFVFTTVNYLVQEKDITTYQIWNEPDQQWLHGGPLQDPGDEFENDYVQMVKVAGEAAEQAGADVLVLGAPSSNENLYESDGWINTVWGDLIESSDVVGRLDAIAIHAYDWPFKTWSIAEQARSLITDKPIWVTESGLALCEVPACGGFCTHSLEQQAAYVLQQSAYARVAGIQVNYHFRMYDDPRQFGLYPASGELARPAATAARLATQYLSTATLNITDSVMPEAGTLDAFGTFVSTQNHTRLVFDSADGTQRITVLWNNTELPLTNISVPRWPSAVSAELRDQTDKAIQSWTTAPETYTIDLLEAATPLSWAINEHSIQDDRDPAKLNGYSGPAVGGTTYLLIESRDTASAPTGSAFLVCDNGRVVGTALRGYDETSGLATLTAACSPGVTYDLSWTQPGRCRVVLIIVLYISPPTAFPTA